LFSHFHSLHFDAPGVGGVVEGSLHHVRDGLTVGEDLGEVAGAEHVSQGGGGQQAGRVAVVVDLDDGVQGLLHPVVDDGVHGNGHAVFGQHLHKVGQYLTTKLIMIFCASCKRSKGCVLISFGDYDMPCAFYISVCICFNLSSFTGQRSKTHRH